MHARPDLMAASDREWWEGGRKRRQQAHYPHRGKAADAGLSAETSEDKFCVQNANGENPNMVLYLLDARLSARSSGVEGSKKGSACL